MRLNHPNIHAFGTLVDGRPAHLIELVNRHGLRARVTNFGAALVAMETHDRTGNLSDIVLGYDSVVGYESPANPHFGATVGRFGNRLANGRFMLDGTSYQLPLNNAPGGLSCHLHGGTIGFTRRLWEITHVSLSRVELRYLSPAGEEGYPGTLEARVSYTLNEANELIWLATATSDRPTLVNMVHHSYWNLSGDPEREILDHELHLRAARYLPTTPGLIPTGEIRSVADTPFDFTQAQRIGARIEENSADLKNGGGYDHAWIFDPDVTPDSTAASLYHPASGRCLEVLTNQPAIHIYTGNMLDPTHFQAPHEPGKSGHLYPRRSAVCLETENFPDAPNFPGAPCAMLRPGETYRHMEIHRFSAR